MEKISRNSIIRLLSYKNCLKRLKAMGLVKVFSDNLADSLGIKATQVRKDFSLFGITGNKRGGYNLDELLEKIIKILGKTRTYEVILIGLGNIGSALLLYRGFEKESIKMTAAFDNDPEKLARKWPIPVFPMNEMTSYIKKNNIELAILAIPGSAAQEIFDKMVAAGVKGVMNFAPIELHNTVNEVVINNVNLVHELENIIYFVNYNKHHEND